MSASNARTPVTKVIYDFGANNGDDLPYYLKKVFMLKVAFNLCRHDKQAMRNLMNRLRQQFS
jgi:hypothetical protein